MADDDREETTVFRAAGHRWLIATVGFTLGACLFVGASALVLHTTIERGEGFIGSERVRSLFALALFASLIAVPTYLLAIASADRR